MSSSKIKERYAIQSWYELHVDESGKVYYDEVIKIPLDLRVVDNPLIMIPCVSITFSEMNIDSFFKIKIETNEGITIEPIKVLSQAHSQWVYILALPPKTTGIKNVEVFAEFDGYMSKLRNNLIFDIMKPPYNYEGAALDVFSEYVHENRDSIREMEHQLYILTERVTALENKAGV